MNKRFSYILFTLIAMLALHMHAYGEEVACPRAFDKIYVCPTDVLCTPQGTYYLSPTGEEIKVSAISRDCNGPYVILITRHCPSCGRTYTGSERHEGFDCPIWENYEQPLINMPNY